MSVHISVRLAWHDSGWNGHICRKPQYNAYCVGPHSFPGDLISLRRDLTWEEKQANKPCNGLDRIPPCCYSINAFGKDSIKAEQAPPDFFRDRTRTKTWEIPPASVCTWPYEEMYIDEVREGQFYSAEKRKQRMKDYFSKIQQDKSLIFYYANYSNPFSEQESNKYVLVGISRVSKIGEEITWDGQGEESLKKYGEYVWARVIQSHYPAQGVVIPYHKYLNDEATVSKIVFIPENPRSFKYGTRHISDDDALDLIERFIEIVGTLKEMKDGTENWDKRIQWLSSIIAELWLHRGIFPGFVRVLDYLEFQEAIQFFKNRVTSDPGCEAKLKDEIFAFIKGKNNQIKGLNVDDVRKRNILRQWALKSDIESNLLENVLPRFDISKEQISRILSINRRDYGIYSYLEDIARNPYCLSEEYVGDGPDDFISFNKIDHGIFLSPELGKNAYLDFVTDDGRRLRALCVEQLRNKKEHSFVSAEQILQGINHKLSYFPDWKKHLFTLKYLEVDKDILSKALTIRDKDKKIYLYLNINFDYEREIEKQIRSLIKRPNIKLKFPLTDKHWRNFLFDSESLINKKSPKKYREIITEQVKICKKIFSKPVSIISGSAGTGKTTVINAIIQAIDKVHGEGASIQLLAPTGKAADRLREITKRSANTIHSFLASRGWLNDNLTFKLETGQKEANISTLIIDESSMLDLSLLGTLFRAINWAKVSRLIFVGDPNQLPPIGTAKVFADIIDWVRKNYPENLGMLETNVRQLTSQLQNKGTTLLDLASLYLKKESSVKKDSVSKFKAEALLQKIQEGGDIDKDLRVVYWNDLEDLNGKLVGTIIKDLEKDTGLKFDKDMPGRLWGKAFSGKNNHKNPEYLQIISPYRGEFFGVDNINLWIQGAFNKHNVENHGILNGITYFDKVIQYRNRSKSDPFWAYNFETSRKEKIEVYNGEIGFVRPHAFEGEKWKYPNFRLKRFQVVFNRKESFLVDFISRSEVEDNLELAYAISVHKSQGSEFRKLYFILPKRKKTLLSRELFYTGLTRAKEHCTIFIEEDISPLLSLCRKEYSQLSKINSSLFEFNPIPEALLNLYEWYEEGKIHKTLADVMVQSKSEVIIANLLFAKDIPFSYDHPLFVSDGTFYRPDFTISWNGEDWYWEHLGMLNKKEYREHWQKKQKWYKKHGFHKRLIITDEKKGIDSKQFKKIIEKCFQ